MTIEACQKGISVTPQPKAVRDPKTAALAKEFESYKPEQLNAIEKNAKIIFDAASDILKGIQLKEQAECPECCGKALDQVV